MTDGDSIAHVAVVILLLGLSVPALATAYDYAGTPFEVNESITVEYSSPSQVDANATQEGYGDSPRVVVNGTTLVEGSDYAWDADDGTVTWYNTSNTTDGATAQIEYRAYQRTAETEAAWSIVMPLTGLFGLFGLVASVRALWSYSAEVWDLS